jgi:hypothetical protein
LRFFGRDAATITEKTRRIPLFGVAQFFSFFSVGQYSDEFAAPRARKSLASRRLGNTRWAMFPE